MGERPERTRRIGLGAVAALAAGLLATGATAGAPPAAADVEPVNPVRVDLDGHPANSGFLAFIEGDAFLGADEAEGTIAVGGDLGFGTGYNIGASGNPSPTFVAPGDPDGAYVYAYVAGGMDFSQAGGNILRVLNGGYAKIGDTSTYSAYQVPPGWQVTPAGTPADSLPRMEGVVPQSAESIATPVPPGLIDIPAAFELYRTLSTDLAACPATIQLLDDQGVSLPSPIPAGARGHVQLVEGQTNVLTISGDDWDALSEMVFDDVPTATTPLLVNVTGTEVSVTTPNMPGSGSAAAPYILWNFADATAITVTGGDSLEGTIYAPRADLHWEVTQNIEGNIIAAAFTHGGEPATGTPREIHDFPFAAELSCTTFAEQAELTLVKEVVGGTASQGDWQLTAEGDTITITGATGDDTVTDAIVDPGTYLLSESGPAGYAPSGWVCVGATAFTSTSVTLEAGDDAVCTIVNTLTPTPPPTPTPTPPPTPPVPPEPPAPIEPGGLPATGVAPGASLALIAVLLVAGAALATMGERRRAARAGRPGTAVGGRR
ncbi:collagen-binding domain-containing protein [Agromyces intestinalis]|nr:collagen-binding domain-containing protein [Agromyces intestinalis]